MRLYSIFALVLLLTAVRPLVVPARAPAEVGDDRAFPGWPQVFGDRELRPLPLGERESRFAASFPGRIGRFTDGRREIILRWVARTTRKLHPASDCYRALGYSVSPSPVMIDRDAKAWSGFIAERGGTRVRVSQHIHDSAGTASPDVSSWYREASFGRTPGPWWPITVAEPLTPTRRDANLRRRASAAD